MVNHTSKLTFVNVMRDIMFSFVSFDCTQMKQINFFSLEIVAYLSLLKCKKLRTVSKRYTAPDNTHRLPTARPTSLSELKVVYLCSLRYPCQ